MTNNSFILTRGFICHLFVVSKWRPDFECARKKSMRLKLQQKTQRPEKLQSVVPNCIIKLTISITVMCLLNQDRLMCLHFHRCKVGENALANNSWHLKLFKLFRFKLETSFVSFILKGQFINIFC